MAGRHLLAAVFYTALKAGWRMFQPNFELVTISQIGAIRIAVFAPGARLALETGSFTVGCSSPAPPDAQQHCRGRFPFEPELRTPNFT
jgi:hypothetical protein